MMDTDWTDADGWISDESNDYGLSSLAQPRSPLLTAFQEMFVVHRIP